MHAEETIARLRQRFSYPLPGLEAQFSMAPPLRKEFPVIPADAKKAAVLILLYPEQGRWYFPLIRRAADMRSHSGQIALPGGRLEPNDPDLITTALRETEEEVGIPMREIEVLGALTEAYIPPSNSLVLPVLGWVPACPPMAAQPGEVAEIICTPVDFLFDESRIAWHSVKTHNGLGLKAPGWTMPDGSLLWGATAMMLAEFRQIWQEADA